MLDEQDLSERLRNAAADVRVEAASLRRFQNSVVADERRRRRSRLGWIGGLSALTLATGLIGGPAAADAVREYLAQSGQACQGSECVGDGGELIDLGASDLSEYVASRYPDYVELPPGMTKEAFIAEVQKRIPSIPDDGKHKNYLADSAVTGTYEEVSYCAWLGEWLDADKSGDQKQRDVAAAVISASTKWPTYAQPTIARYTTAFAQAAEDGDRDGVSTASAWYHCGRGESHGDWIAAKGLNQ